MDIILYNNGAEWVLAREFSKDEVASALQCQELIDQAMELLAHGGSLRIASGEVALSRTLVLGSHCRLLGSGSSTRLIPSDDFEGDTLVCLVSADQSSISSLSVDGLDRVDCGITYRDCVDCRLADITASRFTAAGIVLRDNSSCCTVTHCTAVENGRANFLFEQLAFAGRLGNFPPNTVNGCTAIGGGCGFEIHKATVFNITASTSFQPRGHGFKIHQTSNSVLVSGCRTFQCEGSAVYVEDAHELNVSSNIFCWQRSDGIVLNNVNWAAINANEIIDSGVRDLDGVGRTGIILHSNTKGVQIVGNTIFNWGDQPPMAHAIYEVEDCCENLFANNHINYVTDDPIVSKGRGSVVGQHVIVAEAAYRNMDKPPFPDFDRSAIEQYVKADRMQGVT